MIYCSPRSSLAHGALLRMTRSAFLGLLLATALATTALAQVGHPAKGSWSGYWGTSDANKHRILLVLDWRDRKITGVINPGANAATVRNVTFDYSNPSAWKVKIEAEGKDASGKPSKIVVDGTLENIGAYYRVFHGTWAESGQQSSFTVTRN